MSHPQNCFCEECRGDNPMPAPCGQCSFVHRSESSCAIEVDGTSPSIVETEANLFGSADLNSSYKDDRFGDTPSRSSLDLPDVPRYQRTEKEPTPMGLLSKYKPRDNGNLKQFKRREFLKKEHFPASGQLSATILELRDTFEGSYSDLLLDIKCGKVEYTVGIKFDSVLLDQIVSELGQDEKRWRGKQVVFELAKGKYINLQREKAKAGASARKRSKSKR